MLEALASQFRSTFITDDRYKLFLTGFKNTMLITVVAIFIGLALGIIISVVNYLASLKARRKGVGYYILQFVNKIILAYVAIVRGTPLAIQLMIMAFLIMAGRDKILVACIAFGLNSAAYVSEVIRGGIRSVDVGQMEAGVSLGLSNVTTMRLIILPQAIKNMLPALCNEGIAVLKETSILGMVAVTDLTRASDLVRSRTLLAFFPLISVALVYFILVFGLSYAVSRLEVRMAKGDRSHRSQKKLW